MAKKMKEEIEGACEASWRRRRNGRTQWRNIVAAKLKHGGGDSASAKINNRAWHRKRSVAGVSAMAKYGVAQSQAKIGIVSKAKYNENSE